MLMPRSRAGLATLLLLSITCHVAHALEFRIDSKVSENGEPAFETVTIFRSPIVYDFLDAADEITIYDANARKFILLNTKRKVKTEIDEETLLRFVTEVKLRASEKGGPTVREAAEPRFQAEFDNNTQTLSLMGRRIEYVASSGIGRFPNAAAARDYFNFVDMYTRLNATRVGALPPQARMELNAALAEHQMFPASIERTLRSGNPLLGKTTKAKSEHAISWKLVRRDFDLIDKAAKYRQDFAEVTFGEYRQLEVAAR